MQPSAPSDPVRCELDADRVMTVWFDVAGKPVNTLSAAVWDGLEAALRRVDAAAPAGVVLASAKPRSFIAGADLVDVQALSDDEFDAHLARGQRILDRLEALSLPTVAALNGDALGGGLEVALACRFRIAADEPRARLGLPETALGLVPGWGGTIRLPRLVGLEQALALMVPGETIRPREAAALGLVDRVVPSDSLLAEAKRLALAPRSVARVAEHDDRAACREICGRFRTVIRGRSGDHLPAPLALIDVVEKGVEHGRAAGADAERRALVAMRATPAGKNLLRLFFLRTAAKKRAAAEAAGTPRPVRTAAVIGGGTTAAGIAAALAAAGVDVHVVEADEPAAAAVKPRFAGGTPVQVSAEWAAVATADLVVEAVVGELSAKAEAFRRIDAAARPDAVLATAARALSVASIAAITRDPTRVIGLHFRDPVGQVPLLEVVRSPSSAADALATGVAVATTLGKTPIVCRDMPGVLLDRVLFPYLREAVVVVAEGADIAAVDAATRAWGMPTGPCALLDEIGLDVSLRILRALEQPLGPRFAPPPPLAAAVARGWLGRTSGRGFYDHPPAGAPVPNPSWGEFGPAAGGAVVDAGVDAGFVERRLIAPMAAEARRVLAEEVVASADAVDLATVLGIGFPAFRGGLATFAGLG